MFTPGDESDRVTVCGLLNVPAAGENVGEAAGGGGGCTVSVAGLLVMPLKLAVMFVLPAATAVAIPDLLTVATPGFDDDQAAIIVSICMLPSL